MSQRYSDEAMAKRREKNRQRFLYHARAKYGDKFDYTAMIFITQHEQVTIGCPDHGCFNTTPAQHLGSMMGCPQCGIVQRGKSKSDYSKNEFLRKFNKQHGSDLELVTDYQGAKSPIIVRCLAKGHQFETTPDHLNRYFKEGCTICANKIRWAAQMMPQKEFIKKSKEKFPKLDFSKTEYNGSEKPITFVCPVHGEQTCKANDFRNSNYGCPACGKEQIGYAGYRIRRLMSSDPSVKSRPTRIALMKLNIWGIETYKLGVTTRSLEARYRESLVKVYFESVLDELDALMLEHMLHVKFKDVQDLRIKKKGMRDGQRWAGDEELYFKRAIAPMLSDLKKHVKALSENDPDYWKRFSELTLPDDKPRETTFLEGEYTQPRPVICLDTNKIYPSATDAAREINASQGNLSMVCLGQRGQVKGLKFAYLDDYLKETVPTFTPYKGTVKQVRCIETGEVFPSMTEAAKAKGIKSPSHISRVCTGKRKSVGGLRWEYYKAD